MLSIKRIYDLPQPEDGYRILVDRLWPRGVSKERAQLNEWCKELAPSDQLRKWFNHQTERFDEFSKRYQEELLDHYLKLSEIKSLSLKQNVCLLYGAKDEVHNQVVVLQEVINRL